MKCAWKEALSAVGNGPEKQSSKIDYYLQKSHQESVLSGGEKKIRKILEFGTEITSAGNYEVKAGELKRGWQPGGSRRGSST